MIRTILHIDFNSFFATVEQQANPRLRGKPIGVTGGDRMPASPDERASRGGKRTVIGAASVEAKTFGVRTGMQLWEAKQLCPQIILVPGDSDKYLEVTKRFINILKDYTPYVEVFSIDECFLELPHNVILGTNKVRTPESDSGCASLTRMTEYKAFEIAKEIKSRIKTEIGEWIRCSVGISYNKLMAKLASNLQKPDGLIIIPNQAAAIEILDKIELDEICGIGSRIKNRLFNLGVTTFKQLRQVPLPALLASFKSYGLTLYNMSRGIDDRPIIPFYEKEEVKSIGHRLTLDHDTDSPEEIKQVLLKLSELVARRLRAKNLVGRTVSCWFRYALRPNVSIQFHPGGGHSNWEGDGMQVTIQYTNDGLDLFNAAWQSFNQMWRGGAGLPAGRQVRMIGISISNLKPRNPENLSFLVEIKRREVITQALDKINDKYGEFTLQRGVLLQSAKIRRMPNPFLADPD